MGVDQVQNGELRFLPLGAGTQGFVHFLVEKPCGA